jgi:hypothetical protein
VLPYPFSSTVQASPLREYHNIEWDSSCRIFLHRISGVRCPVTARGLSFSPAAGPFWKAIVLTCFDATFQALRSAIAHAGFPWGGRRGRPERCKSTSVVNPHKLARLAARMIYESSPPH